MLAAVLMATVPMATAAPAGSVEASGTVLPEPLAGGTSEDGIELARGALQRTAEAAPKATEQVDQAHRNLETAEAILSTLGEPAAASQEQLVPVADTMARWQASTMGIPSPERPDPHQLSPSEAVDALLERHHAEVPDEQREALRGLDELPGPVADALSRLVQAHLEVGTASRSLLASVDASSWEALEAAPSLEPPATHSRSQDTAPADTHGWADLDVAPLLGARLALVEAAADLRTAVTEHPTTAAQSSPQVVVPGVLALDLAGENSTYTEDVALSIDVGGNDDYRNNAGGNAIDTPGCTPGELPFRDYLETPAASLVDVGGHDTYGHGDRSCGVNGGAITGSGLLVDLAGEDTYQARYGAVNGGGAYVGLGALFDRSGNDTYDILGSASQGGGGFKGAGLLVDLAGDDEYRSLADAGVNGGAWRFQGLGALVDAGGSDGYLVYEGESPWSGRGVNGGAYGSSSTGFLLDASGDDRYPTSTPQTRGGANGGAVDGGVGFLIDGSGNDRYTGTNRGVNGGALVGGSLGMLTDLDGDDAYTATSGATNGGALWHGHGHLVDASGDDTYEAGGTGANGAGQFAYATGLLLDGSGTDRYEDNQGGTGTDKTVVPKGVMGAQLDIPHLPE